MDTNRKESLVQSNNDERLSWTSTGQVIVGDPNTNLISSRTSLPLLKAKHKASDCSYWTITGVYAVPSSSSNQLPDNWLKNGWEKLPQMSFQEL